MFEKNKNNDPQAKLKSNNEREKYFSGSFKIINPENDKNKNILLLRCFYLRRHDKRSRQNLKENSARRIIAIVVSKLKVFHITTHLS